MYCENKGADQISFAVTAKLICAFVFAYADCWFSPEAAQMYIFSKNQSSFTWGAKTVLSCIGLLTCKNY